ncbi:pyridoxal phosphate-dependent decarboxylase family protein [Thalassotalea fusca]
MQPTDISPAIRQQDTLALTQPQQFVFNQLNLSEYKQSITQGLTTVVNIISKVEKPCSGVSPQELTPLFDHINLEKPVENVAEALEELTTLYFNDAVYFHHPKYVAHLNCPIVYPAILAELILSSLNSSLDTWDQSVGGTLIEQSLIDWTAKRIGFGENADGIFTSGGTQSNLMALLLARDAFCRDRDQYVVKTNGLPQDAHKFRIFTSEISHFSVQKSAAILGLGYDAVVPVAVDSRYKMDSEQLERSIIITLKQGLIPIAVVATSGTTDFGSIDPINQIADLCEKYGLWLHADAAYGCGLLTTENYRHKLHGLERANSVTIDYHKSFFQPVSCGAFFVKDKRDLSVVTHHAEYLNPLSQRQDGTPNLVDKSIQTTRRFDALKLWLTLRIMGSDSIGLLFEQVIAVASQAYYRFKQDEEIEVLHEPELSTLVFRFIPSTIVNDEQIDKANEHIRKAIFRSGEAVLASTKVHEKRYLKFTLLNPETTINHLEEILQLIKKYGRQFFNVHLQG